MSDEPKIRISIKDWWQYEKDAFHRARKETSRATIGRGLVVSILAFGGQYEYGLRGEHDTLLMVLIAVGAGGLVYLVEFLIKILTTPAKIAKEQAEEIAALNAQIQTQKPQIDERENRKKIISDLANFQTRIEERYWKIAGMKYFWDYANNNEQSFEKNAFDPETQFLFIEIEIFLENEIPGALAEFKRTTNMNFTPVSPTAEFRKKRVYWQSVIDHLKHRESQIKDIKDRYIANENKSNFTT
jgi:hypothetical protein